MMGVPELLGATRRDTPSTASRRRGGGSDQGAERTLAAVLIVTHLMETGYRMEEGRVR